MTKYNIENKKKNSFFFILWTLSLFTRASYTGNIFVKDFMKRNEKYKSRYYRCFLFFFCFNSF